MGIFSKLRGMFKDEKPPVSIGETGVTFSKIYSDRDFPRYNPDEMLINKGRQIYKRMMQDDQVKPVMLFKQMAVISRNFTFKIDDKVENTSKQEEMVDFFNAVVANVKGSWSDKLLEILSAMRYGYSITEKIYEPFEYNSKSYWGIKDLKLRPFETFDGGLITDKHGNLIEIKQNTYDGEEITLPLTKVVHFVHSPDVDRHYGESDLKAAYRPYWGKDIAIKFYNIHLERHAHGFIHATIDSAKGGALTPGDITNLKNVLGNLSANTSLYTPASVKLDAIQPLKTDAYNLAIAVYDKAISKSLLVPNLLGLSEQGEVGSYSQSETQLEAFFWILDYIATRLEEALNEQVFRELALWNFGVIDFPKYQFEPISDSKKLALAKLWLDLVKGNAVTKSDTDETYLRQMLNFPEKEEEEDIDNPEDTLPVDNPDEIERDDWLQDNFTAEEVEHFLKAFQDNTWMKRVNFVKIEKMLDKTDKQFMTELALVLGQVKQAMEKKIIAIGGEKSWSFVNPKQIEKDLFIPKPLITKLRQTIRGNLNNVLEEGYSLARRELPVKKFARVKPGITKDKATKYLSSKAMRITSKLETDIVDAFRNVLENAIKFDKSLTDVIKSIESDSKLVESLPNIDSAGRAVNIPHRIETIVRTNTSDALNQARQSLFNDPELKGFVMAYEYSAILDDRTTDICESLDGKILRDFGEYVPPNHFNCRSVLIPVTEVDDWDGKESSEPTKKPQKGFYKS